MGEGQALFEGRTAGTRELESSVCPDLTFAKPVSTIRYAPSEKPFLFKSGMVMRDFPYASGQWGEGKQTLT